MRDVKDLAPGERRDCLFTALDFEGDLNGYIAEVGIAQYDQRKLLAGVPWKSPLQLAPIDREHCLMTERRVSWYLWRIMRNLHQKVENIVVVAKILKTRQH